PKRALSAYMFFSQDWRERIKTENPDAGFGEVGKLLGAKWKELSDDERKPYIEMAAKDKARAEEEKASMTTVCPPLLPHAHAHHVCRVSPAKKAAAMTWERKTTSDHCHVNPVLQRVSLRRCF
ncbi:high mobility group box-domain-containing protein, partial [Pisolithus albus]